MIGAGCPRRTAADVLERCDALAALQRGARADHAPLRDARARTGARARRGLDARGGPGDARRRRRQPASGAATAPGPTLLLGSHLDSVRDAGRYDGPLGVLVALAVAERLRDRAAVALEVVAFADEEGAALRDRLPRQRRAGRPLRRRPGSPARDARRRRAGGRAARLGRRPRRHRRPGARPGDAARLRSRSTSSRDRCSRRADLPVGVVDGDRRPDARAASPSPAAPAHAGTTPMDLRHDALAAAAEWIGRGRGRRRARPAGAGRHRRRARGRARRAAT